MINFNKNYSKINYFDKFSLNYFENFNFGTEIIKKDVEKVCSLSSPTVENIFCNLDLSKLKEENYLQKKIFVNDQFRKISYKHLNEIIDARISEIIEKIFKKNSNLIYFRKNCNLIYIKFEDKKLNQNFHKLFLNKVHNKFNLEFIYPNEKDQFELCETAAEVFIRGWDREAIAIVEQKKSIITSIFSKLFKT